MLLQSTSYRTHQTLLILLHYNTGATPKTTPPLQIVYRLYYRLSSTFTDCVTTQTTLLLQILLHTHTPQTDFTLPTTTDFNVLFQQLYYTDYTSLHSRDYATTQTPNTKTLLHHYTDATPRLQKALLQIHQGGGGFQFDRYGDRPGTGFI